MRTAALYDVHGNLPALEATLAEVDLVGVEAIVCGGDLVWGPLPAESLALLRERGARFLMGNCERDVLGRVDDTAAWAYDHLDDEARSFLAELPATVSVDGVLYCHGTPRSDEEILSAATTDDVVAEVLAGVAESVVVCGHTHQQYDRTIGHTRLVNAGSVGLPYEGRRAAFWAIVDGGEVELRETAYDVDEALLRLRASGYEHLDRLLGDSLLEPVPREGVIAHWERVAGRGA